MKEVTSEINTLIAILPQVLSGESVAVNGPTVDRKGYQSAVCSVQVGNVGGDAAPTRFGVTVKVQEKSGETDWVDVSSKSVTFSGESVATMAQRGEIAVDLRGCARYIRAVATPTFTAGTNPALAISADWVLGEASVVPV